MQTPLPRTRRHRTDLRRLAGASALAALLASGMVATAQAQVDTSQESTEAGGAQPSSPPESLSVAYGRRHVLVGSAIRVTGRLSTGQVGRLVLLQRRAGAGWRTIDRARTARDGRFVTSYRVSRLGAFRVRARLAYQPPGTASAASRPAATIRTYRRAFASWYGPGLYGNRLACGGRLTPNTLGVAHKSLPCGTRVTFRYRGRTLVARVIDRGPYIGGRTWDLTARTKRELGFGSTGYLWSSR